MEIEILLFAAVIIAVTLILLIIYLSGKNSNILPQEKTFNAEERVEPSARRRTLIANRNATARQIVEDDVEDEAEPAFVNVAEGKIGAKKLAKLQAKAEKKAQRENEVKIREEKKKAQILADEERKKSQLLEEEEERKKKEQLRKIKEEKEKQELEEYMKLKEAFTVQEEGFDETEESDNLLHDFINFIKANKIIILEDIASQFKLKTQDVIKRINYLQDAGELTGVIDDRGKFIFISENELDAVAKFVRQRGRVSIVELVESSNKLINLTPAMNL